MSDTKQFPGGALALLALFALLGLAGTVRADPPAQPGTASPPPAWHHLGGGMHDRSGESGMLQVLHQLDLSESQKQQIRSITDSARAQWRSQSAPDLNDLPSLANPGDPRHAAAVQAAQARAAQRIQDLSDVEQQVYAVLSPAQQAQLPQLLAQLQAKVQARREAHRGPTEPAATP
ncbi:MAG TPA: Spy/CpxP family protein refolding chaperone [Steroidobacteraceae bacterium]|nr:Spy/CpxP family protein refolding chaperone [Steroidobacteraceae bacterium]